MKLLSELNFKEIVVLEMLQLMYDSFNASCDSWNLLQIIDRLTQNSS